MKNESVLHNLVKLFYQISSIFLQKINTEILLLFCCTKCLVLAIIIFIFLINTINLLFFFFHPKYFKQIVLSFEQKKKIYLRLSRFK